MKKVEILAIILGIIILMVSLTLFFIKTDNNSHPEMRFNDTIKNLGELPQGEFFVAPIKITMETNESKGAYAIIQNNNTESHNYKISLISDKLVCLIAYNKADLSDSYQIQAGKIEKIPIFIRSATDDIITYTPVPLGDYTCQVNFIKDNQISFIENISIKVEKH